MRAIWKGYVSFGLVTIPVGVGLAQERSADVSFRTLSRATGKPVKQKRWDVDRDLEVTADDVVKGWEFAKGQYVAVEDEEIERFAARQEKTIEILQFVSMADIDPVYYEKAYWLEPQDRAERPYALLVAAMEKTGRAAIGRFVLSTKEHLVLLRPFEGMLTLETLLYPEDVRIRDHKEIVERVAGVDVKDAELEMAEQLVGSLTRPFDPAEYPNETRKSLLEFLEAKAAGHEPAEEGEEAAQAAPVVDLMAALKASLAAASGPAPTKKSASAKPKEQLSIEQSRLRGMQGGGESEAAAEDDAEEAAPARKRSRKAS